MTSSASCHLCTPSPARNHRYASIPSSIVQSSGHEAGDASSYGFLLEYQHCDSDEHAGYSVKLKRASGMPPEHVVTSVTGFRSSRRQGPTKGLAYMHAAKDRRSKGHVDQTTTCIIAVCPVPLLPFARSSTDRYRVFIEVVARSMSNGPRPATAVPPEQTQHITL